MNSRFRHFLLSLFVAAAAVLLVSKMYESYRYPPPKPEARFPEHLALAGEFSGPLPLSLDEHLKSLALKLEDNPAGRAVLKGKEPTEPAMLTPGYLLWHQQQKEPHDYQLHDLQEMGYSSLIRVLAAGCGFALGLLVLLALPFLTESGPPLQSQLPRTSVLRSLAVVSLWFLANNLLVVMARAYLAGQLSRFWLVMIVQSGSYLLGLLLLAAIWKWGPWRPWRGLEWKWLSQGYLLLLFMLPATEYLVNLLTGIHPTVQLSLLPYFRGLSAGQGVLLCVLAVLVGPVVEELLFRGCLLGGLAFKFGKTPSIVLSSLLFALVHLNFWGWPVSFIFGMVTGWIALRTNSVATGIAIHILWNASTLCWVYLNV